MILVKIFFLTICLDGFPWLPMIYSNLRQLPFEWHWSISEGVAANVACTRWCRPVSPRLSNDGTTQWLDSLTFDHRVTVYRKKKWPGKIAMVNEPLKNITEPCLLWEMDADEIFTVEQIIRMRRMFIAEPDRVMAQFFCRYFVGPNIVTMGRGTYGNRNYDWLRCWRFEPGMRFQTHEPPVLIDGRGPLKGPMFTQEETAAAGLVFDHYAYALRQTVEFKEKYYGLDGSYEGAIEGWERLQRVKKFPVFLKSYFPWVKDETKVTRL